jgi:cadmium resistance protein CadD (predicted permease)
MRRINRKTIALVTLTTAAAAGFAVHGWIGLFLWPLALCGLCLQLVVVLFLIDVFVTLARKRAEVSRIKARLSR